MRLKSRRGNMLVEFAIAGIPILLLIISVVEISRCMWTYTSLSYAVTEASRLASVHARNCGLKGNSCTVTVSYIAGHIRDWSPGLDPSQMNVWLITIGSTGATVPCVPLQDCIDNNADNFATKANDVPGSDVIVTATYPFTSPLTMFFPGLTKPTAPIKVGPSVATNMAPCTGDSCLSVASQEPIHF